MSGTNDNRATVYDLQPHNPSSLTFLSSSLNEEFGSKPCSGFLTENENAGLNSKAAAEEEVGINFSNDLILQQRSFGSRTHVGFSESMSARKGFNLPKLDTTRIPLSNMGSSPDICSPYVTIPPGLSPTMLLDSPVFLSNSMVQASPTTGKLQFAGNSSSKSILVSVAAAPTKIECELFEEFSEAFAFYPPPESHSNLPCAGQKQELSGVEVSAQPRKSTRAESVEAGNSNLQNQENVHLHSCFPVPADTNDTVDNIMFRQRTSGSLIGSGHSLAVDDQQQDVEGETKELSAVLDAPADEDGYNWRKYGQKQVKGSEYPRSYYKCTHPNCQAKKKVERSHEGHATEIVYKGSHNHLQPHPNRRSVVSSSRPLGDPQTDSSVQPSLQTNFEDKADKGSSHNENGSQDFWGERLEAISSAPGAAECGDPSNTLQHNQDGTLLSPEPVGASSTMSNDEEEDDGATHGSVSLGCDGEDDETESRRRKLDACAMDMNAASRAVREPRVVVQTTSEVDILDDGYRWRKYGQKVVKGNPNPRSYYKCTNPGCTVRKHIERASHDLKSVITTYEGRHNHEVPAARSNGGHPNAALASTTAISTPQPSGLAQRHELPTQDGFRRFDGRATLNAYGFLGRDHLGLPTTSFPFAVGQPGFAMHVAGFGPLPSMKLPMIPPIDPYLGHHREAAAGFMVPKAESNEEALANSQLHLPNGHQQRMTMDRQQ